MVQILDMRLRLKFGPYEKLGKASFEKKTVRIWQNLQETGRIWQSLAKSGRGKEKRKKKEKEEEKIPS